MEEQRIPLISVIIPVYNAQKHIVECLKSITNQTLHNIEIICVNDGSTDNSVSLINKLSDQRIIILNQPNSGPSEARNTGIKYARGKYIAFVDSDDILLHSNVFENIYNILSESNADILQGTGFYLLQDSTQVLLKNMDIYSEERVIDAEKYLITTLKNRQMLSAQWLGIYKRDFIIKNNILNNTNIMCGEDTIFVFQALLKADKVVIYSDPFYGYRYTPNSITKSKALIERRVNDIEEVTKILNNICHNIENRELKNYLYDYTAKMQICTYFEANKKGISINKKIEILRKSYSINMKVRSFIFLINTRLFYRVEAAQRKSRNKLIRGN